MARRSRTRRGGWFDEVEEAAPAAMPELETCSLCGRPILPRSRASRHHLVPKLKGGARLGTVRLHQICHSAIHARYSEAELARRLADIDALRAEPEIARFLAWVSTKPADFHVPTRMTSTLKAARPRKR